MNQKTTNNLSDDGRLLYCFDTSAINALHDDTERDAIVAHLLANHSVYVSAISVMEICKSKDRERYLSLMRLTKQLVGDNNPLELPNALLVNIAKSHRDNAPLFTATISDDRLRLWDLLQVPERLTEHDQEMIQDWIRDLENSFLKMHQDTRAEFESNFNIWRPRSAAEMLKRYLKETRDLQDLVGPMYEFATDGKKLDDGEIPNFFHTCPSWAVWAAAWGLSMYRRVIQKRKQGKRRNPGGVDTWSVVYLGLCDVFVTHDTSQRRAFRFANVFNSQKTLILSYRDFRQRLLLV